MGIAAVEGIVSLVLGDASRERRFAEWSEIDLDEALWTVPAARMKRELQVVTRQGKMVLRGERHHQRAMSENTINAALWAMGFAADEVTGHGFRATAHTMLHERLGFDPDVMEAQLAHSVRDSLGRAYNRTEFIRQRRAKCCRPEPITSTRSGRGARLRRPRHLRPGRRQGRRGW